MLLDSKGRRYLVELASGGQFHYHRGVVTHDELIGRESGTTVRSSKGSVLTALRPRLADYVLTMERGATVVYPKDAAAILMWADISPGDVVLEAGTGSGALTMALTRAVLPGGRVISVETRTDHAERARALISGFFGTIPDHLDLRVGEVEDVIADVAPDRIVLDLPEPWHAVAPAAAALTPGGVFCCYLPTVPQVQQVRSELARAAFVEVTTFEVLMRDWAIDGRSVRPSHRMIGHTGFITVARSSVPTAEV